MRRASQAAWPGRRMAAHRQEPPSCWMILTLTPINLRTGVSIGWLGLQSIIEQEQACSKGGGKGGEEPPQASLPGFNV